MRRVVFIIDGKKACGKCKIVKPITDFAPSESWTCGYRSYCKECDRSYYRDNPARKIYVKEAQAKRLSDPEYKRKVRETNKLRQRKEETRIITRANTQKRYKNDPAFKVRLLLASRLNTVLKGCAKTAHTQKLVGCSFTQLKEHLESLWLPGMNWENHGRFEDDGTQTWHIDHIIPCASFDLTKPEEQHKCFHYTNLQPLWAIDNVRKGDWVPDYQI